MTELQLGESVSDLPNFASIAMPVNCQGLYVFQCDECDSIWVSNNHDGLAGCPRCNAPSILLWNGGVW